MGLLSALACIIYAALLLKGAWDYWAPYANLPPTEGRWFPTGFVENSRGQGWYETQDIPVPFFLTWLADVFNDGEAYEKLPKVNSLFCTAVFHGFAALSLLPDRHGDVGWAH